MESKSLGRSNHAVVSVALCPGPDLSMMPSTVLGLETCPRAVMSSCFHMHARRKIFIPVQTINFTINPPQWRIPFLSCAGFVWVMWLSFAHGDAEETEELSDKPS